MDLLENSMDMKPASTRIHPLMAGAAVSVIVVSLTGIAALTGLLPSLHATAVQPVPVALQAPVATLVAAPLVPVVQQAANAPARQDDTEKSMARPKPIVHQQHQQQQHAPAPRSAQYSQAPAYQAPAAAYQAPPPATAPNSPIGIGVGAVVGGLLGNQVGGGNGKTLATIAGAVGGGYLGNEIAKRNP